MLTSNLKASRKIEVYESSAREHKGDKCGILLRCDSKDFLA